MTNVLATGLDAGVFQHVRHAEIPPHGSDSIPPTPCWVMQQMPSHVIGYAPFRTLSLQVHLWYLFMSCCAVMVSWLL